LANDIDKCLKTQKPNLNLNEVYKNVHFNKIKKAFFHKFNFEKVLDGWIKSGRDKISACRPQIGPNVQHTDEKFKYQKETNKQTDRISKYKIRIVHRN
jgi:hypothetical protein